MTPRHPQNNTFALVSLDDTPTSAKKKKIYIYIYCPGEEYSSADAVLMGAGNDAERALLRLLTAEEGSPFSHHDKKDQL